MTQNHVLCGLDFKSTEACSIENVRGYLIIKKATIEHRVKANVPWPSLIQKLKELGITLNPPL